MLQFACIPYNFKLTFLEALLKIMSQLESDAKLTLPILTSFLSIMNPSLLYIDNVFGILTIFWNNMAEQFMTKTITDDKIFPVLVLPVAGEDNGKALVSMRVLECLICKSNPNAGADILH